VLSTGAGRVRRVARLLEDPNALIRLAPVGAEQPRLDRARDRFEAQRRMRCDWYRSLGTAVSQAAPAPAPEPGEMKERGGGMVTLERAATAAGGGLQPGLAIAWAQLHLDVLTAFEPTLTAAYVRITDAGVGVESKP
jgi:hypothetical protein